MVEHPAEGFAKLFIELVRDRAIESFDGREVPKTIVDAAGDVEGLIDSIVNHTGDVLTAFLAHENHLFRRRGDIELPNGKRGYTDWIEARDDPDLRHELDRYVLRVAQRNCQRRVSAASGPDGRQKWASAVQNDPRLATTLFVAYVVDAVAAEALAWIDWPISRSFAWQDKETTHTLKTLDDLNYQYFDGDWLETYSRYPAVPPTIA